MKLTLPIKYWFIFWTVALIITSSAALFWSFNQKLTSVTIEEQSRRQNIEAERRLDDVSQLIDRSNQHLKLLSQNPLLQEAVIQLTSGSSATALNSLALEKLDSLFRSFLKISNDAFQIRLIASLPSGHELIRFERQQEEITKVPSGSLQYKGDSDYVIEAQRLSQGEIYSTAINLNKEHGVIETPLRPTFRVSTPIYVDGDIKAILVVNQDIEHLLTRLQNSLPDSAEVYLFNRSGQYLIHPDKRYQFAHELGRELPLADELMPVAARFQQLLQTESRYTTWHEQSISYSLTAKRLGSHPQAPLVGLLILSHHATAVESISNALKQSYLTILLVVLIASVVAVVLAGFFVDNLSVLISEIKSHKHCSETASSATDDKPLPFHELNWLRNEFRQLQNELSHSFNQIEVERSALSAILETAVDGIVIIDSSGVIQRINPAITSVLGYQEQELIGQPVELLIPASSRKTHAESLARYNQTRIPRIMGQKVEVEALTKDNTTIPILLSLSEYYSEGEWFYCGIFHDLSEQKQLESELRQANLELESRVSARTAELHARNSELTKEIAQHKITRAQLHLANMVMTRANQAICITDADNKILEINDAFIEMTGFSRHEAIGSTPSMGKSGRHDHAFYQKMWRDLLEHNRWEGEIWDRKRDGTLYPKYLTIDRLLNNDGQIANYVAMFQDLTEQKATEEELERRMHYDLLTGLSNRSLFRNRLSHEFDVADRRGGNVALILINIDRFKQINDTFGYQAGDKLLQLAAKRLANHTRKTDLVARKDNQAERGADTLARLGGNEFSIILSDLNDPENASIVARRILAAFENAFWIEEQELFMSVSIGISIYPENGATQDSLTNGAEKAMSQVKRSGGNDFQFYSPELHQISINRFLLESEMRKAVTANQFTLFYQPKYQLEPMELIGTEALIRWPKTDGTMVSPADFIPLAEQTGLINPLGAWIIKQALNDTQSLSERLGKRLKVAVNLSARQFNDSNLIDVIDQALAASKFPASDLELEITESMVMDNVEQALNTMQLLRKRGISLAIDDFGTGYSSLAYLKRFPVNTLKIDQSFVRFMQSDNEDAAIVSTVCSMGRELGLDIVAEGIETLEQLNLLQNFGCQLGQGFYLARPMPIEQLVELAKKTIAEQSVSLLQKGPKQPLFNEEATTT